MIDVWRFRINKEAANGRQSNRVAEPAECVCRKLLTNGVKRLRKCWRPDLTRPGECHLHLSVA